MQQPERQVLYLVETKDYIALEYSDQYKEWGATCHDNPFNDEGGVRCPLHLLPPKEEVPDLIDFKKSIEISLFDSRFIRFVSSRTDYTYRNGSTCTVRDIAGVLCIPETVIVDTFVQCFTSQDGAFIVLVGSPEFIRSRTVRFEKTNEEQRADPFKVVHYPTLVNQLIDSLMGKIRIQREKEMEQKLY